MRRMGLAWILLVALMMAACSSGLVTREGLIASAVVNGNTVTFTLDGYTEAETPALQVTSSDGYTWTRELQAAGAPRSVDGKMVLELNAQRIARFAVEDLRYEWKVGNEQSISGEVRLQDPKTSSLLWQLARLDSLVVYHAAPLPEGAMQAWLKTWKDVSEWTGQKRQTPPVIWVFPDVESFSTWAGLQPNQAVPAVWHHIYDRVIMTNKGDLVEQTAMLAHEMAHALSPQGGPLWFREGFGVLIEGRQERLMQSTTPRQWENYRYGLQRLQLIAQERAYHPDETAIARNAWDNPYTVGVSIWLFVKRHHGDAGVKRFLVEGAKQDGVQTTLESMFGKKVEAVWADWNAYVRSPQLLADWDTP